MDTGDADPQRMPEPVAATGGIGAPLGQLGIALALPANIEVRRPGVLDAIPVVKVVDPAIAARVEIYAERIPDDMTPETWRALQRELALHPLPELSTRATTVAGRDATFRELASEVGTIWETEVWVGQVVYRVSARNEAKVEPLYRAVLDNLRFTGEDQLPPNAPVRVEPAPASARAETPVADSVSTLGLKFPFNGSATITCAYYADDTGCHANSRIALDFNLSYEAVRATHAGTIYQYSDACGGKQLRITSSTDSTYRSIYAHLDRYFASGTSASQGEYIARSGETGSCASGPHLHYELEQNGNEVKPEPMCGKTGFLRYQGQSDCWSSSESFATDVATTLTINSDAVNLKVCASNLPGRTVYVSMWRNGSPERSWKYSKVASTTCVTFSDMDGAGGVLTGTYYYTNVALRDIPADLASQQKSGCLSTTGNNLACDRVIYP